MPDQSIASAADGTIPTELMRQRIDRLREAAAAADLRALVIFAQASRLLADTTSHGNLRYLLDWTSWFHPTMLVLPIEGELMAAVPQANDVENLRECCPFLEDVRCEQPSYYGTLARMVLGERGVRGRIGLLGAQELTHEAYSRLVAPDPAWSFEDADELLDRQRMVKDEVGLARLRRAAAICDAMFQELAEVLRRPGIRVWEAQAAMNRAGLAEGAEYAWTWMVAGNPPDRGRGRREENLRVIEPGDCVVAGIYLVYAGYYGHILRTLSIGEPSEDMRRVWRAVSDAQQAAAAMLKPGVSARVPPATADETLFRHFPEVREGDRLRFRTCHFIGLDYSESPTAKTIAQPPAWSCVGNLAVDLVDLPLEAGMTMEIHPNTRPPGFGFGAVGDVFVVTPDGGEPLTTFPRELQVISPG